MPGLNQIIDVQISRNTKGVSQVGFGTPLILGSSNRFAAGELIRDYNDMAGVAADFQATDPEYAAAVSVFSQQQSPSVVKIAYRATGTGAPTLAAALDAITHLDDDWYCLLMTSRVDQDILDAAVWIEAHLKIFIASNGDAAITTTATTDVLSTLHAAKYSRTAFLFSGNAATYPEMAWAGLDLPYAPGSETWKFKSLQGSIADNLTATQSAYIKAKGGNTYETYASVDVTADGTMVDGEFIDVIRYVDSLQSRIKERIFSIFVNNAKIPYTDAGAAVLESAIRAELQAGVRVNAIVDGSYSVHVPTVIDQNPNDRAVRYMPGITFTALLAGAIHKTQIKGTVTV